MSGVLHPVGPEPVQTYWLRRAVLLAAIAALVGLVVALTSALGSGSQAAEPSLVADGSPTTNPSVVTPSPTMTSRSTSSPSSTGSTADRQSTPLPTAPPAPKSCDPTALRPQLRGDRSLKAGTSVAFTVVLTNGAGSSCTVALTPQAFELKIYSGTDRIWSTKDCTTSVRPVTTRLSAGKALTWRQSWNGGRSASGCKTAAAKVRPGVYWATAQFSGAEPVQLRMIIR